MSFRKTMCVAAWLCAASSVGAQTLDAVDLGSPGPHPVGTFIDARPHHDSRTVAQIWYPTVEEDFAVPVGNYFTFALPGFPAVLGFESDALQWGRPLDCESPAPILIYSHSANSVSWEMFWLFEHLASHGWIVAAPQHEDSLNNTDVLTTLATRRQDVIEVHQRLLLDSVAGSTWRGCVDPEQGFVVAGRGEGGFTAYALGGATVRSPDGRLLDFGDEGVNSVLAFAPTDLVDRRTVAGAPVESIVDGAEAMTVPVLTMAAEADVYVGDAPQRLHDGVSIRPKLFTQLGTGTGHYSFAPGLCFFDPADPGCQRDALSPQVAQATITHTAVAWLEHLRGRSDAIEQLPAGEHVAHQLELLAPPLVSPTAVVSPCARLEDGVVVESGAVVGCAHIEDSAVIGAGAIIEDRAVVGARSEIASGVHLGYATQVGADSRIESSLGNGVVVGERAVVMERVVSRSNTWIGDDVFVGSGAVIEANSRVGNEVFIGPGARVGHYVTLGNRVVVGAGSNAHDGAQLDYEVSVGEDSEVRCLVRRNVQIGDRVFLHNGCRIAARSIIGDDVRLGIEAVVPFEGTVVPDGAVVRRYSAYGFE